MPVLTILTSCWIESPSAGLRPAKAAMKQQHQLKSGEQLGTKFHSYLLHTHCRLVPPCACKSNISSQGSRYHIPPACILRSNSLTSIAALNSIELEKVGDMYVCVHVHFTLTNEDTSLIFRGTCIFIVEMYTNVHLGL